MSNFLRRMFFLAFLGAIVMACELDEMSSEENEVLTIIEIDVDYNALELEITTLVNNHRISIGLKALEVSGLVSNEANTHTDYMVQNAKASHDNFDVRVRNLMKNALAINVAENVGYGYATASALMNAWLNNSDHRKNIEGVFTHFGVAAKADDSGRYYVTQLFIER